MSSQYSHPLVPGRPNEITIAVYRPVVAGERAPSSPVATVEVDDPTTIAGLIELLNGLTAPALSPSSWSRPSTGAHDMLHFTYPDGGRRTIKVTRDGSRSVSAEGLPGSWAPTLPLIATIDVLLPVTFREEIRNPMAYPPSEHPQYISEDAAIAIALGGGCGSLPAERPPISARMMTRDDTGSFDPAMGANNAAPHPARKVWLVSVHDEVLTWGRHTSAPTSVHGYSLVIDAETGTVTDMGWGTAPLGKENCAQCRE